MTRKRGAEHVIDFLAEMDIETLFMGPVGHTNLELLEATRAHDDVSTVMAKHELVAGYMACGYYRVTHKPGVVSTHTSPGLGNTLNQFASSYLNSSAIVDLHTDSPAAWRGQNSHHEFGWGGAFDMAEPVTKDIWDVTSVDKLAQAIPQAFNTAVSGRPGPTLVNLPMDVLAEETETSIPSPTQHVFESSPKPTRDVIDDALELLVGANRPLLLAGGGTIISEASTEISELAETAQIPVATTDSGKGIIPENHELAVGTIGSSGTRSANELTREADVILAIGTRFGEFATSAWTAGMPFRFPDQGLIQIDINPEEIGRYYPVDVGVVSDASEAIGSLLDVIEHDKLDPETVGSPSFATTAQAAVEDWRRDIADYYELDDPLTMGAVITELREHLPADAIVTADSGKNRGEMVSAWQALEPQTIFMDTGNGAMGYGPCAALGAQVAAPDRTVVSVSGDGGFLMVNNAMATAVEYDLPVTWILLNDNGFVSIAGLQEAYFDGAYQTYFTDADGTPYDIDYVKMAESFSIPAQRVSTPDGLENALAEIVPTDGPSLIDVTVSREGSGLDNGAQWVQAGRGTGVGESN